MPLRLVSLCGLGATVLLAWLLSNNRSRINWRTVIVGIALQLVLALLILDTPLGFAVFREFGRMIGHVLDYVDVGSRLVFGEGYLEHPFAFKVMPTIIVVSSLTSMLYYLGVMKAIVNWFSWAAHKTLGTSGAETLSRLRISFSGIPNHRW